MEINGYAVLYYLSIDVVVKLVADAQNIARRIIIIYSLWAIVWLMSAVFPQTERPKPHFVCIAWWNATLRVQQNSLHFVNVWKSN